MAKKRIFSGEKLSEKERKRIEEQLKKSRERDIRSMKESEERRKARNKKSKQRRITDEYREAGFSSAKTGKEAQTKFGMIMKALDDEEREDIKLRMTYMSSGDVIEAADFIVSGVKVSEKDGRKYFTVDDLIDAMEEIVQSAYDDLPDDFDPLADLDL